MPGIARTTGWPPAVTLVVAVVAGIALGSAGAVVSSAWSDEAEPDLLFPGLSVPALSDADDPRRLTVGLTANNRGGVDFRVTGVRIPGWTLAEPDAVDDIVPAGRWASLSFDIVPDCSDSRPPGSQIEVVGADGETVVVERDGALRGLGSIQRRACVDPDTTMPQVSPAVDTVTARTDPADRVMHVDIDVVLEAVSEQGFQLAAVTGHASGFRVELADRFIELDAGATTTVTTDWRVIDCGAAAGTTGTGAPDPSSSGNFDGPVLHWYWDDPARSEPARLDLRVDLPPEVVIALARFAVAECDAGEAGT